MKRKPTYIDDKNFKIALPFAVKELGTMGEGDEAYKVITIEGFASYCGDPESEECCYIDRANDVVLPAGMDLGPYKKNPVVLLNHERECPIGKALDVQKKANGIFVTAEIHEGACDDEEFYAIENGLINSFSIGFRTKAVEWRTVGTADVCFITKSELFEISCVTIPCNTESGFAVIKSFGADAFSALQLPTPTQPVPAVTTKSTDGDTTMKLKRKELLTPDAIERHKSLGLDADLEGEVEVSTKSYLDSLVAKRLADLKAELLAEVEEKLKALTVVSEGSFEGEQPAAEEETAGDTKSAEDDVEIKEEDVKSIAESVAQLKAALA